MAALRKINDAASAACRYARPARQIAVRFDADETGFFHQVSGFFCIVFAAFEKKHTALREVLIRLHYEAPRDRKTVRALPYAERAVCVSVERESRIASSVF